MESPKGRHLQGLGPIPNHTKDRGMKRIAKTTLSLQSDIDRLVTQTQALMALLIANDQFKSLNPDLLGDVLWIAADRIDEVKQACNQLFEEN
jgi:translation initiation factor 6 (eIF-6)